MPECCLKAAPPCRRSLKGDSKLVVAEALKQAQTSCMAEHRARRLRSQQILERLATFLKHSPEQLPSHLQMVLAALQYAHAEVLWYFWHVNEVRVRS